MTKIEKSGDLPALNNSMNVILLKAENKLIVFKEIKKILSLQAIFLQHNV